MSAQTKVTPVNPSRGRKFVVDTLASFSFYTPLYLANDLLMGHMSESQLIISRGTGTLMNLSTGRLYGMFKDWTRRRVGIDPQEISARGALADGFSASVFGTPLNLALYAISSGEAQHFVPWIAMATSLGFVSGVPYGIYLGYLRTRAGTAVQAAKPENIPLRVDDVRPEAD